MTLISLASKQIWPQVLAVAHLRPQRLLLLHSEDDAESRRPALRLKRLFDDCGLLPKGATSLGLIPHNDFNAVSEYLDQLAATQRLNLGDSRLNFTGGNKLMATAAFRWAARRSVTACYLERGNVLTWFEPGEGLARTRSEDLDGHATDSLDPLSLLQCQLEASEVERDGEILALNQRGLQHSVQELERLLLSGADPLSFLVQANPVSQTRAKGDRLELITALYLLKNGVNGLRRSVRLKVRPDKGMKMNLPHAELDLLFNHGGRLWLVDCKDRKPAEDLVAGLWPFLGSKHKGHGSPASRLIGRIGAELAMSQAKVLKEDLVAVREIGGLLGRTVCVRRQPLPPEVEEYAKRNGIVVIYKSALPTAVPQLLHQPVRTIAKK